MRAFRLLATALSFFASTLVVVPQASAASCAGVTVAVDTSGAGGGLVARCAPGDPGDARTALERAGFAVRAGAGTGSYGDRDYVCRVDGLPSTDACDGHADGEAYWKVSVDEMIPVERRIEVAVQPDPLFTARRSSPFAPSSAVHPIAMRPPSTATEAPK